ncbi:MAG: hypothetical protein N3G76_00835 [Candidatus Micrarchaeota archaeon]|nr:hypothetical protein [Candidatus Micrarchaeota archaeon]
MKILYALALIMLLAITMGCISQPSTQQAQGEKPVENATPEKPTTTVIKEKPKIVLEDYPSQLKAGEVASFKWSISGAKGSVPYMAVYIGKESNAVSDNTAPDKTSYTLKTPGYPRGSYNIPGKFTDSIKMDEPGTYYARAHTVVDGKNIWSEEVSFAVVGAAGQPVKEFKVMVINAGFEPNTFTVRKGDLVKMHFEVGSDVNPAGVRIVSPGWKNAPALKPGEMQDVEFTADSSFEFSLYWLAGNLLRGKAKVTVE